MEYFKNWTLVMSTHQNSITKFRLTFYDYPRHVCKYILIYLYLRLENRFLQIISYFKKVVIKIFDCVCNFFVVYIAFF